MQIHLFVLLHTRLLAVGLLCLICQSDLAQHLAHVTAYTGCLSPYSFFQTPQPRQQENAVRQQAARMDESQL